MKIKSINFNFVPYLALIEAISFYFVVKGLTAVLVGFIPALGALILYKFISPYFPIKINNKILSGLPIMFLSIVNGLFIMILFYIQEIIPYMQGILGNIIFGFLTVFLAALVLLLIYNNLNFKISFKLNGKKIKLKYMSLLFVVYMGIFEAFILPIMIYLLTIHAFLNGLISGLIGGAAAWFVVNAILGKKPLEISL